VQAPDALGAGEVGQRARHAQHAVVAAGREAQTPGRLGQQRAAGGIGRGDLLQQLVVGLGALVAIRWPPLP